MSRMTVSYLQCDGDSGACDNIVDGVTGADSRNDLRELGRQHGWLHVGNQDFCPEHQRNLGDMADTTALTMTIRRMKGNFTVKGLMENAPEKISRTLIDVTLTRMVERGELIRVERGTYRNFKTNSRKKGSSR